MTGSDKGIGLPALFRVVKVALGEGKGGVEVEYSFTRGSVNAAIGLTGNKISHSLQHHTTVQLTKFSY